MPKQGVPITKFLAHPKLLILFLGLLFFVAFGALLFMVIEGWTFIDALYFTVATVTTVGYGDVVPTHDASKVIATIYMALVVPVMLIGIGVVTEIVQERRRGFFSKKEDKLL